MNKTENDKFDEIDEMDSTSEESFKQKLRRVYSGLSLYLKFGIHAWWLDFGYDFSKLSDRD
jgi:hypothetical protein